MRKLQFLLLALILVVSAGPNVFGQLSGDTFAAAKQSKVANVTYVYSEAPGFASMSGGSVQGVCVDIMSDFKDFLKTKYGITLNATMNKADADDFTGYLETVKKSSGGVFGLSNTTITDARKQMYSFSPPYITNIAMILTSSKVPTLGDLTKISETFAGMKAVTVKNSTNEQALAEIKKKYFPSMQMEYVASFSKVNDRILNDPNVFASLDFTYYLEGIKNKAPLKRHPAGDQAAEQFGIIMPKGSDWVTPFNEFLTESYRTSSEYRKIIADHLGPNALKLLDAVAAGSGN
jgi:ABC-type amino acid transport substrate-binding protein